MKKEKSDAIDAALRREPEYKELCRLLSKQTIKQKARLEAALSEHCEGSQGREADMSKVKELNEQRKRLLEEREKTTMALKIRDLINEHGQDWESIAEELNKANVTTPKGLPWTAKRLDQWAKRKSNEALLKLKRNDYFDAEEAKLKEIDFKLNRLAAELATETIRSVAGNKAVPRIPPKIASIPRISQPSQRNEQSEESFSDSEDSQTSQACEPETVTGEPCESIEPDEQQPCERSETSQEIPPEWLQPLRELIKKEIQSAMTANLVKSAKLDMDKPPRRPKREDSREHAGRKATLGGTRIDSVLFDAFHEEREKAGISASALMERILWLYFGKPSLSFEESEVPEEPDPGQRVDTTSVPV